VTIDLKTLNLEPRRQTFGHIARRFGEDRPASRYEEGMLDVQATKHFHYRPYWEPEKELYDASRTAVVMEDWYSLRDPRQYYYATYNINRAGMRAAAQHNFDYVAKRGLLDNLDAGWRDMVVDYLLPLRHVAWGANMNATQMCDRGYGTAFTAPCIFAAGDHLGIAQVIGQIGMDLADGSGEMLDVAKDRWMNADYWQGIRKLVEDTLVEKDPLNLFVAQMLVIDGLIYPLVYEEFDAAGQSKGGAAISMLTEFMSEWFADNSRWTDAVIKTAAAESEANAGLLSGWYTAWSDQAVAAVRPLAAHVLGADGDAAVDKVLANLNARAAKLGLTV